MKSVDKRPSGEKTAAPKTKFCEVLATTTPTCFTALGSRPWAVLTRFWMSTAARSGSRLRSKVAVITEAGVGAGRGDVLHAFGAVDLPLQGVVTADSTVCALAPV